MNCRFFVLIGIVCLFLAVFTTRPAQAQNFETLYAFKGVPDGANQWNAPLLYRNGTLYGTTFAAGVNGGGTVYKIDSKGTETVLYSFCSAADCADGWDPQSGLLPDWQGNLYGVALFGGDTTSANCINNYGCGTLFKLDNAGNLTVLHTFTGGADGNIPQGLNMDWAGNFYGITFAGGDLSCSTPNNPPGCGVLYKLDTKGNLTVLHTFTGGVDGASPNAYLTLDWADNIYGVTTYGGNPAYCSGNGCGTVYRLDRRGKVTTLHTYTGLTDGSFANGSLVLDAQGNLYGTTYSGGDLTCNGGAGCGTVFKLTTAGKYRVLHTFNGAPDGAEPPMGLMGDWNGNLYGVTEWGGNPANCTWAVPPGCGTVFKLDPRGKLIVLYTFTGLADGAAPGSGLTIDMWGNLYGNTVLGGDFSCDTGWAFRKHGCGVVYRLKPWERD